MNFNNILLTKIDSVIKLTKEFDDNYKQISIYNEEILNENIINSLFLLTKNYIKIRSEHGYLLILFDKYKDMKKNIFVENDENNITIKINESENIFLYDLSTFNSIFSNINELINNIDFEYKRIATKYPKFINMNPLTVLLISENIDGENEYIKLLNDIKVKYPENIYKIAKSSKSEKKIKCNDILGINLTLKINKLPTMYIINGSNIIEIPIDKFNNIDALESIIK